MFSMNEQFMLEKELSAIVFAVNDLFCWQVSFGLNIEASDSSLLANVALFAILRLGEEKNRGVNAQKRWRFTQF